MWWILTNQVVTFDKIWWGAFSKLVPYFSLGSRIVWMCLKSDFVSWFHHSKQTYNVKAKKERESESEIKWIKKLFLRKNIFWIFFCFSLETSNWKAPVSTFFISGLSLSSVTNLVVRVESFGQTKTLKNCCPNVLQNGWWIFTFKRWCDLQSCTKASKTHFFGVIILIWRSDYVIGLNTVKIGAHHNNKNFWAIFGLEHLVTFFCLLLSFFLAYLHR